MKFNAGRSAVSSARLPETRITTSPAFTRAPSFLTMETRHALSTVLKTRSAIVVPQTTVDEERGRDVAARA
jgi:hypothetical protein